MQKALPKRVTNCTRFWLAYLDLLPRHSYCLVQSAPGTTHGTGTRSPRMESGGLAQLPTSTCPPQCSCSGVHEQPSPCWCLGLMPDCRDGPWRGCPPDKPIQICCTVCQIGTFTAEDIFPREGKVMP